MKKYFRKCMFLFALLAIQACLLSCQQTSTKAPYTDHSHFSEAFGKEKSYRLYLPEGYEDSDKQYPVIYFFHGWGGRHFKDDNALLEYEMISALVDKYEAILVMWDGNIMESQSRPYNIGNQNEVIYDVQMKDYFPELVRHIDNTYRTLTDREYRGIIGYSMGGFMSFYLAGKYPEMISAAVNMTGSIAFFVGHPDNNTLYPLRHTFENLRDVQVRLHNSSAGELSSLNREVDKGARWDGKVNYEYWEFEGGHKVDNPGETEVFERAMQFVSHAFQNPQPQQKAWSHYDLYADFDVWGYSVESNKKEPGFLFLRNVSPQGFGFYTRKWLPSGPAIQNINAELSTPPIYEPNEMYKILDYQQSIGKLETGTQQSDGQGCLHFTLSGAGHEIGIYQEGDAPKLTLLDYSLQDGRKLLQPDKPNSMSVRLINLGEQADASQNFSMTLSSGDSAVVITENTLETKLSASQRITELGPFTIHIHKAPTQDAAPASVKFTLSMQYDTLTFEEEFDVPVFFDVPAFDSLSIDDGVLVRDSVFGVGNGDGIAAPGESIMLYTAGHRTQLFTDDPYVEQQEERVHYEALPAKWTHNGITLSSIIKIAEDCPEEHIIDFLAKYETKDFMPITRHVHWGRVSLRVKSK